MATIHTTDNKGTDVIITGPETLTKDGITNLSDKQIDSSLAKVHKGLEKEKANLDPHVRHKPSLQSAYNVRES